MDVDATNQSTPPLSTARPTATDPRLTRVSNTPQNSLQAQKAPHSSTSSRTPTPSVPEQPNASNSPSTGGPSGPNGLHYKESESASLPDIGRIVPLLTQLFDSRVTISWKQWERTELQKEDAVLRKTLGRARGPLPGSFPSAVDSLHSMRETPTTELQKLEADLTKQQAICSDLAEELRGLLRDALCAAGNEKTMKIEAKVKEEWKTEFEDWKAECKEEWKAESKEEIADLEKRLEANIRSRLETEITEKLSSDLIERLRAEFKEKQLASTSPNAETQVAAPSEFQEQFDRLENSVNFVSKSNRNLGAQISRVENWKKDVEEGRMRLPSQSEASSGSGDQANFDLKKLEQQIPVLETRLVKVEQQHSEWSGLQSLVNENTATLQRLKGGHELGQNAERKIATLETQIQQIQKGLVAQLRGVPEETQRHRDAINDLSARAEDCRKAQETTRVALRSLEHRYNSINSEELVKSMANAMTEMYPGMQTLLDQYKSLQVRVNTNKEIAKEIDRLRSSVGNEERTSIAGVLEEFKKMSERFDQLQETQKSQADDIVCHLEELKEVRNQLDGYSLAIAELGDKQADDLSDLSEEIKALVPRFGEYDTRLESQAKQCKDLEESVQRVRTQLDALRESASEDNIRRICEDAQREKLQAITGQLEEFNSQGMSVLKRLEDMQHQGFGSADLNLESSQSQTNGLLSSSGINGSSTTPQNANPRNMAGQLLLPPPPQATSNNGTPTNAPNVPTGPRALMRQPVSSAPSPGAVGGSFRIKGVASQNDSERGQTSSSIAQSSPRKDSNDAPMSSRVTANPSSPSVVISQNRSATTGPDFPGTSSAPNDSQPSNSSTQASSGKKRPRQSTISDDESREERRAKPVLSDAAKPSPAPSPTSDAPLRKSKKLKKKEKRQQSQSK